MRHTLRRPMLARRIAYVLISAVAFAIACRSAGGRSGASKFGGRADVITDVEIGRTNYSNLYDVVQALRSRWLLSRGPDTILGPQGEVQVHLDDARLGGVQSLRNLSPVGVAYIQWFDPISAAQRWGLGYGQGAIYVSTRPKS